LFIDVSPFANNREQSSEFSIFTIVSTLEATHFRESYLCL
jgi:hypothetical protein